MKFQRIQDLRTDADMSQKCLSGWQIITTPASIISSAAQTAKK